MQIPALLIENFSDYGLNVCLDVACKGLGQFISIFETLRQHSARIVLGAYTCSEKLRASSAVTQRPGQGEVLI